MNLLIKAPINFQYDVISIATHLLPLLLLDADVRIKLKWIS